MKRSLLFLVLAQLSFAQMAFGNQTASFSGTGKWKTDKARTNGGSYTINMDITRVGIGKNQVFSEIVGTFGGTDFRWNYVAVQRAIGSSFYDLFVDNVKSGWGFCISIDSGRGKKCNYNAKINGIAHQLTFVLQGEEIIRMGSHEDAAGNHYVWRDHLAPSKPEPFSPFEDDQLNF